MPTIVQCPYCKKEVLWSQDSPYRPFCSERCRLIDLGAWADNQYSIPTTETPKEESDLFNSNHNDSDYNNEKEIY